MVLRRGREGGREGEKEREEREGGGGRDRSAGSGGDCVKRGPDINYYLLS